MNKCKYLTIRSKNYEKYFYCRLNKKIINYTNECIKCVKNEPRKNKGINKVSKKKIIKKFVEKCNKFDESVEIKGVSVGEEYRILETVCKTLDLVEKLQKENEELKNQEATARRINELLVQRYSNSISLQKVKDKIRHYQELQDNYIKKYDEINEGLQAMINVLQELIEEREEK